MSIILTALIGLSVAHAAFASSNFQNNVMIIRQYRPKHFLGGVIVLTIVMGVAVALIQLPGLNKNPFLWIFAKISGSGNGTGHSNIIFSGMHWKLYMLFFLPILLFALPSLARQEEELYRRGTKNWHGGTVRSILFGLAHLFMMIPLGAAFALSIGGLWFTHLYFQGGVQKSTIYHSAYNSIAVIAIFTMLFIL